MRLKGVIAPVVRYDMLGGWYITLFLPSSQGNTVFYFFKLLIPLTENVLLCCEKQPQEINT